MYIKINSISNISNSLCKPWIFRLVLKWNKSESALLEFASLICKFIANQSWTVCNGLSRQFREEIFYVFRHLESYSSSMICGLLLEECADAEASSVSNWNVVLPPKPKRRRMKKIKETMFNRPLHVLQLTDIHLDFQYSPDSEADCALPVCCHESVADPKQAAGFWGTVGNCDIPYHTVENMLQHINVTHEVKTISSFLRKLSYIIQANFLSFLNLKNYCQHRLHFYFSFAPHFVDERFWPTWLYQELLEMSQPWLEANTSETILFRGSYSTRVMAGLRLISLNTGFCETTNFFLYLNQSDPDGTMSWLVKELYKAESAGEYVQILAHIPPGDDECLEGWARNYYRVVQRFSSTIVGQFFGHVHLDFFTIYYSNMHDTSSKPVGEVIDFENYFVAEYAIPDLSPSSWNRLVDRILQDEHIQNVFVRSVKINLNEISGTAALCNLAFLMALLRLSFRKEYITTIGLAFADFTEGFATAFGGIYRLPLMLNNRGCHLYTLLHVDKVLTGLCQKICGNSRFFKYSVQAMIISNLNS
uniref:Metallophos domain-containing protein n=1 Tax=Heterorhabditis bacteriophora TaxID=37862 RepID=A0A1I7WBV5_HETBA